MASHKVPAVPKKSSDAHKRPQDNTPSTIVVGDTAAKATTTGKLSKSSTQKPKHKQSKNTVVHAEEKSKHNNVTIRNFKKSMWKMASTDQGMVPELKDDDPSVVEAYDGARSSFVLKQELTADQITRLVFKTELAPPNQGNLKLPLLEFGIGIIPAVRMNKLKLTGPPKGYGMVTECWGYHWHVPTYRDIKNSLTMTMSQLMKAMSLRTREVWKAGERVSSKTASYGYEFNPPVSDELIVDLKKGTMRLVSDSVADVQGIDVSQAPFVIVFYLASGKDNTDRLKLELVRKQK